jgi:hypothetical protein
MGRPPDSDPEALRKYLKQRMLPVMVPGNDNALFESDAGEPDPKIDPRMREILEELYDQQEAE